MVVRLDLERYGCPVAEVEDSRVLPGSLENTRARRGQPFQEKRRVLVAAVLGPEQREDRELEVVRLALQEFPDPLELAIREPERAVQRLFRNLRQAASLTVAPDGARQAAEAPGRSTR